MTRGLATLLVAALLAAPASAQRDRDPDEARAEPATEQPDRPAADDGPKPITLQDCRTKVLKRAQKRWCCETYKELRCG